MPLDASLLAREAVDVPATRRRGHVQHPDQLLDHGAVVRSISRGKVIEGEVLLQIDGEKISAVAQAHSLLRAKVGAVWLKVRAAKKSKANLQNEAEARKSNRNTEGRWPRSRTLASSSSLSASGAPSTTNSFSAIGPEPARSRSMRPLRWSTPSLNMVTSYSS
eukprot:5420277-Prymnesium_polylepis.2